MLFTGEKKSIPIVLGSHIKTPLMSFMKEIINNSDDVLFSNYHSYT